jgi:hypothetical protein
MGSHRFLEENWGRGPKNIENHFSSVYLYDIFVKICKNMQNMY